MVATIGVATSYTDNTPGKPGSNTYRYYLKAFDTCGTQNQSAASNTVSNR
jgi:hypothetical protein